MTTRDMPCSMTVQLGDRKRDPSSAIVDRARTDVSAKLLPRSMRRALANPKSEYSIAVREV
eukprot:365874-Chlamydomonas_euryale.AAC.6